MKKSIAVFMRAFEFNNDAAGIHVRLECVGQGQYNVYDAAGKTLRHWMPEEEIPSLRDAVAQGDTGLVAIIATRDERPFEARARLLECAERLTACSGFGLSLKLDRPSNFYHSSPEAPPDGGPPY